MLGAHRERLGRVADLVVRLDSGESLPPLSGLKAQIGGRDLFIPASQVASLEPPSVRISTTQDLGLFQRRPGQALLRGDLLGRSLIHVSTAQLVRAWEIEMVYELGSWRVAGVDASARARLRRMLPPPLRPPASQPARFIGWSELEAFLGHVPSSRLRLASRRLVRLHPAQLADLVEAASHAQGEEILHAVEQKRGLEAGVLEELDDEHRVEFLRDRSDAEVAALLAELSSGDAADLLMQLDQRRRVPVLNLLPTAKGDRVRELLSYNPATAGGIMNPEFPRLDGDATVADAIAAVRGWDVTAGELHAVYVSRVDDRLTGAVAVAALLRSPGAASLSSLVTASLPTVSANTDIPEIACVMSDYDLLSLPVVDEQGRMIGVVALEDLVKRLLPEDWRRRHQAARA